MVPLAEQALPQLMTDQRWQQRHAALICLAQIAEGCAKVMLQNKQVTGLVQMCKQVSHQAYACRRQQLLLQGFLRSCQIPELTFSAVQRNVGGRGEERGERASSGAPVFGPFWSAVGMAQSTKQDHDTLCYMSSPLHS